MAIPLVFKMGTGAITNPTPGTYYISKTEKDGTYKWNIQIADDNGALYDILTPDNVKGLEYIDGEGNTKTIAAEELNNLIQDINDNITQIENDINLINTDLSTANIDISNLDNDLGKLDTKANGIKETADAALARSGGEMTGPIAIRTLGENEEFADNEAINKQYLTDSITPIQNDINDIYSNKINKANDTFTGDTTFGTENNQIITTLYGTQNFVKNTTNFENAPLINGNPATTVNYVNETIAPINETIEDHEKRVVTLENEMPTIDENINTAYARIDDLTTHVNTNDNDIKDRLAIVEAKTNDITIDEETKKTTIDTHNNRITTVENEINLAKPRIKTLEDNWSAFMSDADITSQAVDTLKEIQSELNTGKADAAVMLAEINNLKNGTNSDGTATPAGRATADADGRNIVDTYETKKDANDAHEAIGTRLAKYETLISVPSDSKLLKPHIGFGYDTTNDIKQLTVFQNNWPVVYQQNDDGTWNQNPEQSNTNGALATKKYVDDAINTLQNDLATELGDLL